MNNREIEMANEQICEGCGMTIKTVREYHPFAACRMFQALRNSNAVRVNIEAVIRYGMEAQLKGVSVDDAMQDFNRVLDTPTPKRKAA